MNYITTDTELTSIANAIRSKAGTPDTLLYPSEFISTINSISGGGLSDLNKDVLRAFVEWLIVEHESASEMYGVPVQSAKTISDIESAIETYGMYRYSGTMNSSILTDGGYTPYVLSGGPTTFTWNKLLDGVSLTNPSILIYGNKAFVKQENTGELPLAYFIKAAINNSPYSE